LQSAIPREAVRILDEARSRALILRLLGGVAIKYHCPSASHLALLRDYPDLDLFGIGKQAAMLKRLFEDLGYAPNQRFNALQGKTRLIFEEAGQGRRVDIFLDTFQMCHILHIGPRLILDDYTIPITDLLLTKLQIVEINEKDIRDIIAILHDHEIVSFPHQGDKEKIDGKYIGELCSNDWGLCHTVTIALEKVVGFLPLYDLLQQEKITIGARIAQLSEFVDGTPKSLKWKMRALVGERVQWYDLPEAPMRSSAAYEGIKITGRAFLVSTLFRVQDSSISLATEDPP